MFAPWIENFALRQDLHKKQIAITYNNNHSSIHRMLFMNLKCLVLNARNQLLFHESFSSHTSLMWSQPNTIISEKRLNHHTHLTSTFTVWSLVASLINSLRKLYFCIYRDWNKSSYYKKITKLYICRHFINIHLQCTSSKFI